jgi:RNA polymerase sigma-70 factor (family 1)
VKLYQLHSDGQLLSCMLQDDERAYTVLYNRYWKKLLVQAFLKLQNREEAEDMVQQVFVNLWKRRHQLQIQHSFATYVAAMLKYEIIRKLSIQNREKRGMAGALAMRVVADDSTRQLLHYHELLADLEKSVQLLPEKCQLVFRLSREKGLSEKEIAETLQIAPKTVQAHIGKALKMLRSAMQLFFFL